MNDLVSIITPSYNTAKFIGETIKSVLNQTYQNWEMIIVDDCSTDNTDEIVSGFSDSRIKYLKNEKNSGAAVSRNRALKEAKGRWIAFLDSDDLWKEDKLFRQIIFMEENGYSFSYTKYHEINEESQPLGVMVSGPCHISKTDMFNYCWPGCLTVMYDSEVIGDLEITPIKKNNDYAMWLKIIKKEDCFLLDEDLAMYRKREGSISNHGYSQLIKWHYRLFRICENKNAVSSFFLMMRNMFFGVYKKLKYVKRG